MSTTRAINETDRRPPGQPSRRLKITLPEPIASQLDKLAAKMGEPAARLAGHMVREGVAEATSTGQAPTPRPQLDAVPDEAPKDEAPGRAPWLEPYGGDWEWRTLMWGAIVALHARYPTTLAMLKEGWWKSETHVETLCALAVWRQSLDDAGRDPREELAFQARLADYGHSLSQEGSDVTHAWQPGAPPEEWAY